jgi:hypothetical protein
VSAARATELSRCTVRFFHSVMLAETGNRVSCPGAGASKRLRPHLPVARTTVLIVFPDDAAIIDTELPSPLATVRMVVQGVGGGLRHTHLDPRSEMRIFLFHDVGKFQGRSLDSVDAEAGNRESSISMRLS